MSILRWTFLLVALAASGQEPAVFPPEPAEPWKPAWELTLRGDRLADPGTPSEDFHRMGVQLRLRWTWDLPVVRLEAGVRTALGTDPNRFNAPRWDQQPSSGTQADTARAEAAWVSGGAFAVLNLGLQENGLLVSQALWDPDLRVLGAGVRAGFRGPEGVLQEAGLRAVSGRVGTVLGGAVDLGAAQAVLKVDTGPLSWTAHGGRWDLRWTPGPERLRRLPGHDPVARQRMSLEVGGASGTWHAALPLEGRWLHARNRETGETSEEVQVKAGSTERRWWPELSYTWQRLSSTGTLYPLNGDEWWYYRRARGPRFDLSVPFPGRWVLRLTRLQQRADGSPEQVTRTLVVLVRRF